MRAGDDPQLADSAAREQHETRPAEPQWCRTIAPLHNLTGPSKPIVVGDELVVRPFTGEEREALVSAFGGWSGEIPSTVAQIEHWTHAIDLRWDHARDPTYGQHRASQTIEDGVRALRLQRPGVTGTTILWTHPAPPDAPEADLLGEGLFAPHGAGHYMHPSGCKLRLSDGPALRRLFGILRSVRGDGRLQLALRRFDSAYARYEYADSLIDLWIAFEALLTPKRTAKLSHRVCQRIARLTGTNVEDRRRDRKLANRSYKTRSEIVHGDEHPKDLGQALEDTRELAREALRRWLLEPPPGGVEELDARLLA
jgi:hypothetical protein